MSGDAKQGKSPAAAPAEASERILVGALAGSFGVRGEVRVKSFCAEPAAIEDYAPLWTEDGSRSFTLKLTRQVPNGFAGRLTGVNTREEADALRGTSLYADRTRLPSLPDDEFYHADLIGLEVLDSGGQKLGRVRAVLNHGAGDILEIHQPGAKQTLLLPFTLAFVPTVDLASGRIIADPPAMADDDEDDEFAAEDRAEAEGDASAQAARAATSKPEAQRPKKRKGPAGGKPGPSAAPKAS